MCCIFARPHPALPGILTDVVNTGARLAVAAVKQGVRMLCTTAVRDSSSYRLRRYGLAMEFVGVIKMKGKADGAEVFTPTTHATTFSAWDLLGLKPLFGRDKEMDAVLAALKGQPATDAMGGGAQARGPVVVMVIEGEAGLGKSALLDHALTTMSDPDAEAPICFEHWLQLTASGEEEVLPFRMVVQIMEWLLQLDGACDLDIASWIMVRAPASCAHPASTLNLPRARCRSIISIPIAPPVPCTVYEQCSSRFRGALYIHR